MGAISWKTVFAPSFAPGGLGAVNYNVASKVFEDFENYANDAAVQAVWTEGGGAANPTLAVTTAAVRGDQSIESAVTGSVGTLTRSINQNNFGWGTVGAGGRLRYIAFKGIVTTSTGAVNVRISDASDANHYKEWAFTIGTDVLQEHIIDLYSGTTTGYRNGDGFAGPSAEGSTTWNPDLIDTFAFRDLAVGSTYRFDDIRFYYEYSLMDAIGFGTEAATDDGVDGSVHSKLRNISDVLGNKGDAAVLGVPETDESVVGKTNQLINLGLGSVATENSRLGRQVTKAAADLLDGTLQGLFTVAGGRILLTHLEGEVVAAAVDNATSNTQWVSNPTVGTDLNLCATLDIDNDEVGAVYSLTGEVGTAMTGGSGGGATGMLAPIVIPEGVISISSSADVGTGGATFKTEMWYMILDAGATVTAV